jgi:type II secretory pathway pseudopilin PulG
MNYMPSDPLALPRRKHRSVESGVTLVEVAVAMLLLSMVIVGLLGSLMQSRRLTEASIYQNTANTIIQGYIEQMKNMEVSDLTQSPIRTRLDQTTLDTLKPSPLPVINKSTVVLGTIPTGVEDNAKVFDINNTPGNPADDLRINIWVWIESLDRTLPVPATSGSLAGSQCFGITLIYVWEHGSGRDTRRFMGDVRTIRSLVPSF